MGQHKTPLRYPGGKQKVAPFLRELILANDLSGQHYVEPYAGGAGVAIELLLSGAVGFIHLNDVDVAIYAFWRSVLNQTEELCRRISRANLTVEEWRRQQSVFRAPKQHSQIDLAFSVLYLNRCNRSGILSAGLIGGLAQEGKWKMDARFPRVDLINRIQAIAIHRRKINVCNLDAEKYLKEYVHELPGGSLVYCDPPYFNKADRLYINHYRSEDHARLATVIQHKVRHRWIVSYDNVLEIKRFYAERRSFVYSLQYNAASAYKGQEVFFFSDKLALPERCGIPSIDQALMAA
jgi:DNA adenine methylase